MTFTIPGFMRIGFLVAWYDFWVGAFYDQKRRRLYVLPLPCIGIWFEPAPQKGERDE